MNKSSLSGILLRLQIYLYSYMGCMFGGGDILLSANTYNRAVKRRCTDVERQCNINKNKRNGNECYKFCYWLSPFQTPYCGR